MLRFDSVNITQNNLQQFIELFSKYEYDLTNCLINCSNQGECIFSLKTNRYVCVCGSNSSCQYNLRPCARYPCLNNGTCVENSAYLFKCECVLNYNGTFCENELIVCTKNITCSKNGYCVKNGSLPLCKCFINYFGDQCEFESNFIKIVRSVTWTSLIICLVCIASFVLIIILNDLWSWRIRQENKRNNHKSNSTFKNSAPVQFTYYNKSPSENSQ